MMNTRITCWILAVMCCVMMVQAQDITWFVSTQVERYPQARLLDLYKSCFQDYMGAEHLVTDTATARHYLQQELATTDVDDLLPWYYEPCGVQGRYVRVSLRAVLEGKLPSDVLLDAFVRSANDPARPSVEQWSDRWDSIIQVIDTMELDLSHYLEDKQFTEGVLAQGHYAISHSPEYREAYHPHYRIIRRDIFEQELLPLLLSGE